jgi:aldehyde dehydrogenase (NAD+)
LNPANEKQLAEMAIGNAGDISAAVGRRAQRVSEVVEAAWSRAREVPLSHRADHSRKSRVSWRCSRRWMAGKPIKESRGLRSAAGRRRTSSITPAGRISLDYAFPGRKASPVGVCGQIIPWNFPLLMRRGSSRRHSPAGNTVVLKPAETTSITALHLAQILQEAELPPGVVNIVTGAGETGHALVEHPDVDKLAFHRIDRGRQASAKACRWDEEKADSSNSAARLRTSSSRTRRSIRQFEEWSCGIFFNQGHVCCAGSRLLVQESVFRQVIHKLRDRIATLRVGDPLDKNTDIARSIPSRNWRKSGSRSIPRGGRRRVDQPRCRLPERGYWFPPSVITGVTASHRVAQEEIFGPVLSVMTFRTPEEAIERANNTPYGLSAGVWTDKGSKIFKMVSKLRAGVVWANTYNKFDPTSPFGGYKESGWGREGGVHGLLPYITLQ